MKEVLFVIGGCRSGKSRFALDHVNANYDENKLFIATSQPFDAEMRERIANHQKERGPEWKTVEAPFEVPEAIIEHGKNSSVILLDCLTLWTSNLILQNKNYQEMTKHADSLIEALNKASCSIVMVSNEVGTGIVPENKLARAFRDAAGMINQKAAGCANRVVWTVAGIPVTIKGNG